MVFGGHQLLQILRGREHELKLNQNDEDWAELQHTHLKLLLPESMLLSRRCPGMLSVNQVNRSILSCYVLSRHRTLELKTLRTFFHPLYA